MLTPDITVRGVMPCAAVYAASLRLLREVASAGPRGVPALRAMNLDRHEGDAWAALFNAGALASRAGVGTVGDYVVATSYGRVYLAQRSG